MSGQSGLRGYVYQGLASIIESLEDESWDSIVLELSTQQDKVDIALFKESTLIKTIQSKSSINLFRKRDVIKWIKNLIDDKTSNEYKLYIIGECEPPAKLFIKSVKKYNEHVCDKESIESLGNFIYELEKYNISIEHTAFDKKYLLAYIESLLNKYVAKKNIVIESQKMDLVIQSLLGKVMLLGTDSTPLTRKELDSILSNFVKNSIKNNSNKKKHVKYKKYIIPIILIIIPLVLNTQKTIKFIIYNYVYFIIIMVLIFIVYKLFKISDDKFENLIKRDTLCKYKTKDTPYIRVNIMLSNLGNEQVIDIENISNSDIVEIEGYINFFNNNSRINTVNFHCFNINKKRKEVVNRINFDLGEKYARKVVWDEVELNINYIKAKEFNTGFEKYEIYKIMRTFFYELNYYNYLSIGKLRIPYETTWLREYFIKGILSYVRFFFYTIYREKRVYIKRLVVILFSTIAVLILIIGSIIGLSKIVCFYVELLKNILTYFLH